MDHRTAKTKNSRVFLQRQTWIVNLCNENINTSVSGVFKTKRELKCQNKLFFPKHQFFVFITENFWRDF